MRNNFHISDVNKSDAVSNGNTDGFDDGNTTGDDYTYDGNGNMTKDKNKGIISITYNHLNLPAQIKWTNNKKIEYLYNSHGEKVQKKVTNGTNIKTTDYMDGFQYSNNLLEFFPHAEGYVKVTAMGVNPNNPNYAYNYVFNYTDHLGNVRISYSKDPQTGNLKILDESHYYPFGLRHQKYMSSTFVSNSNNQVVVSPVLNNPYQYKYNGKEWQNELGWNMYDMDMRQYDPAIARWVVMDPVVHHSMSPYNAFDNNPVYWADPSGMDGEHYNWETGRYEDDKGNEVSFETAMASVRLNPDGSQQDNEDQVPPYDINKYKDVQVMDEIGVFGTVSKYMNCNNISNCFRIWTSPDGTKYDVDDYGFVVGLTSIVIGGAGSLEFIGGAGVLLLKIPNYLKYIQKIKTAKDLLSYGVKASKSFELLRTGGKYKAVIEGGAFGAGQYYTQLLKEGWQAVPLSKGGFKLIKDGSEIFFRSSKSGGRKALDTFTLPKAYNGKNVDLFFK